MTSGRKILIADNDATLLDMLSEQLQQQKNFITMTSETGAEALALSGKELYDAIILGANLPDMDGWEVCQKIRRNDMPIPIIMLVNSDFDENANLALKVEVSAYIKKPFRIGFLLAKLDAYIRCYERQNNVVLEIGPYNFEPNSNLLLNATTDENVRLTNKEAEILQYLYQAGNCLVERDVLLDQVWGYNSNVTTHTLETHVYRLRQKIESDPAHAKILVTEPGGYRLVSNRK